MTKIESHNLKYSETYYRPWFVDKLFLNQKTPAQSDDPYLVTKENFLEMLSYDP